MICPECGQENPEGFRLCGMCGASLVATDAPRADTRKTVTVLFCDVTGSTALGEKLDPEATRKLMARYFETARGILEQHGASVEKFIGDAVMAVFGIPQVHEDDAFRAARAALELRDAVDDLKLRIGVNTGEVVAGSGETLVTGDAVNVAARLEQAAQPGEVLVGEHTYRLIRDAVEAEPVEPLEAKGKSAPLRAYRLARVVEGAAPFARRLDSPLVGREREQRLVLEAFERAVDEGSCHLFTLLGSAGIGKSRLTQELVEKVADHATVLTGRCLPYGEGITYWPLVEILRELGGESRLVQYLEREPNARSITNAVFAGVGIAESEGTVQEETFWAVRKLFEALAREQPLVVVLDDLHWGEPTFLDLVEHIADWSREAPILLLCLARPELLDARPAWGGGKMNATSLLLDALSEDETETLIDNLLAKVAVGTRKRIAEAAEGNPLFVEQMLAMVAEQADLGPELEIPPTIQALLAARLDRLPEVERAVLERAAVVGKEFSRAAIEALDGDAAALPGLVRKELIRPHRSPDPGDDGFRFLHLLVRDAAYDAISKELRAELHERVAGWIAGRRSEYDEIVGYHLEQAHGYVEQLAGDEERANALARRAAARLGAAGKRAGARGDAPAAVNLLDRATALLPADDQERLALQLVLANGLSGVGEGAWALDVLTEVLESAARTGERVLELRASLLLHELRVFLEPEGAVEELRRVAEEAIRELEQLGDDRGLAEAWGALGTVHMSHGQAEQLGVDLSRALEHAGRAGEPQLVHEAASRIASAAAIGPTPLEAAIEEVEQTLDKGNRRDEAWGLSLLAELVSQRGDFDQGGRLSARARELLLDLGQRTIAAGITMITAWIPLRAGDPVAAEAELRPAHEALESIGEKGVRSGVAAVLAEALFQQGRLDEADRFTRVSEEAAASDDVLSQVWWRGVRAKIHARRGNFEHAARLAREAAEIIEPSDWLVIKAWVLLTLGEVLLAAGESEPARESVERALELYEQKGDIVDASRARQLLDSLQPTKTP
jgi:class 3 adenylate cyclase/tetratricopeptide (TPR) repeat protein